MLSISLSSKWAGYNAINTYFFASVFSPSTAHLMQLAESLSQNAREFGELKFIYVQNSKFEEILDYMNYQTGTNFINSQKYVLSQNSIFFQQRVSPLGIKFNKVINLGAKIIGFSVTDFLEATLPIF